MIGTLLLLFRTEDKYEIRHQALLEVIRFCGGVTAYSELINVARSRVSNWLNQLTIDIPYEYVLLTEYLTGVSIERLSPFTEAINKMVRSREVEKKVFIVERPVNQIVVEKPIYCGCCNQQHSIIVGTDGVLIRCLSQLEAYKKMGKKKIPVTIIDLESL